FKSADQGREKFQGASLDFVWFDEEPPEDIYNECRMRLIDKKGDIFGTMTPLKGLSFIYHEIYLNQNQNPEIWYTQMEWKDNPYLDAAEVDAMMKSTSEDVQESRRFGRFHSGTGLVYPEFSEQKHVIEPFDIPYEWQSAISIDPGLNNPLSAHFYAVDGDGVIYVVAEHYQKGKDVSWHSARLFELADAIGWRRDREGRLTALIDSAAGQRTLAAQKSVAELFIENGILVNTRVNKDLFSGIAKVKSLFCQEPPKIYIFKNCVNLIRELKGYFWGQGDTPKKTDDHALDELRYFVMSCPKPAENKRPKSVIEKDKEKLIRSMKKPPSRMP
ncbi:MAG TPA: terminase family protein, partial [Clostridia bacterium]|nr:terminase family protein [Clostridia bacterium]